MDRLSGVVENDVVPFGVGVTSDQLPEGAPTDADLLTQYIYNISGSRVDITNAKANRVTLTDYDTLERPKEIEDALGNAESMTYDALGNVRTMTDRNGEVTVYQYDGLNRLTDTIYQADGETISYSYDAAGNRKTMTDGVGTTVYSHDTLYRITNVNDALGKDMGYEYEFCPVGISAGTGPSSSTRMDVRSPTLMMGMAGSTR